ncbi:hypothetical protein F5148DRAFT_577626 [Russula earlei]|uniref:Uncharacterized protein n=1 Tax=Russula earlei TaxID=71964 RepID=A0ACC0TWE4_9AGAM|nr:hypothetical protein F5148DRAFT_577626 [Russula earlei]
MCNHLQSFSFTLAAAMEKPFPQLTSLYILGGLERRYDNVPSGFVLRRISPASATTYVGKLSVSRTAQTTFDWVTALSVMLSTPYPTSRLPPPLARSVLPFLTKLAFEGDLARALVPRSPVSPHRLPRLVAHSPDSMLTLFSPEFSLLTSVPSLLVPLGRTNLSSWQHLHVTVPTYTVRLVGLIWKTDNHTCNNSPLFHKKCNYMRCK